MKLKLFFVFVMLMVIFPSANYMQQPSATHRLFVSNEFGRNVTVVDIDQHGSEVQRQVVPMGGKPYETTIVGNNAFTACVATTGSSNSEVEVYDTATLAETYTLPIDGSPFSVAVTKNGKRVFTTNRLDHKVWTWDLESRDTPPQKISLKSPWAEWAVRFCALSADESTLFVSGQGGSAVYRIDTTTLTQTAYLTLQSGRGMAVSSDTLFVATESPAGLVAIDIPTFKIVRSRSFDQNKGGALTVVVSANGSALYVAQAFGPVQKLNAADLTTLATADADSSTYHYGVFTAGNLVGITSQAERGTYPNSVKLYDATDLKLVNVLSMGGGAGPYLVTVLPLQIPAQQ